MTLSDLSVRRPVFATVLSLLIVAFGVLAFTRLPVRELPSVDFPIVSVEVRYRGAASAVIETRITEVIESGLSGIEGIKSISSNSQDGRATINVEFESTRKIDDAANDVRDRVAGVRDNLPLEADPPDITKVDADASPIMFIALQGKARTPLQLFDYADRNIIDRISAIDGVARVDIFGISKPAMRIWLDRKRMTALQVTADDVEQALRAQNVELPAGRLESARMNYNMRIERQFATPKDFAQIILRRSGDGYLVRLGDVARIEVSPSNPYTRFRANGIPSVVVSVVRQSNANTLAVARAVRAEVADISTTLPKDLRFSINYDSSVFIDEAIKSVYHTLAEAALLVLLVIYLFLGSVRATLMPAVTVPVSLLGAALVLYSFGFSINLLTLLAMVLAIGLVVDDAIVVLENIHRRIEHGETPLAAAYTGTRQVGFAVIASTLVVMAVFVPVLFIGGNTGKLFRELAGAMVGALGVSLLLSLTLTPAMASKILRHEAKPGGFAAWVDRRFNALASFYQHVLGGLLARRWLVAPVLGAIILAIVFIGSQLKSELAPEEDVGVFSMTGQLVEGAGYDYASAVSDRVEKTVLKFKEQNGSIFRVMARVPGGGGGQNLDFNTLGFTILLKPWSERSETTREVMTKLQKLLQQVPEGRFNGSIRQLLAGQGRPVSFVIMGDDFESLARARDAMLKAAESNPGIQGLDADYRETKPQLLISVERNRAAELGVSQQQIGRTLETMMGSRRVTTYFDRGEEYDVILQADRQSRASPDDLLNSYVRSERGGALVPLSNLISAREVADAGTIGHFNKLRAITLNGGLAPGYTLGEALNFLEQEAAKRPEVIAIGYKGQSRDFKESSSDLYFVLGLALLVIILLLAAQFESFVHPFTIILTVPMAISGAVLGLWVMGGTLNIYSQVAVIMLVGLATKNGILIVEFANQLRDAGRDIAQAVMEAALARLRPIVMTSIATVAGAMPLMLASGAGAESRIAIGTVIVFGVSVATLLSLVVVPSVYALLARYTGSPEAVSRELDRQLGQSAKAP